MVQAPPRRILLATDLSGRCDRALDRAAQLAGQWSAELVVVHALEWADRLFEERGEQPSWRRDSDRRIAIAERQIRADLSDHPVPFRIVIEEAEPAQLALKVAQDYDCDLIVTGTARSETFGRLILGATVDRLVRRSDLPVLVVKSRVHGRYAKLMVATDFSDESLVAYHRAVDMFSDAGMSLLHCYRPFPVSSPLSTERASEDLAREEMSRFVNATGVPPERRNRLELLVEPGPIEAMVNAYAADKGLDLLVIGSRGRGALATLLLGSTAERLLMAAACDVLIVRGAPFPSAVA